LENNNTASIVSKVWSFCHTLRDDGVGYGDYLEQLTYLIFLKMADEYGRAPYNRDVGIPAGKDPWTKEVWVYDYRTNVHHTLKKKPLRF
jgi:type I restriction-modification system DNA methylase subunit